MPRPRKAPEGQPTPTSFVASAARLTRSVRGKPKQGSTGQAWQDEAWQFMDTCGELAFAGQWVANALSRVRLYLAWEDDEGNVIEVPDDTTNPLAREALAVVADLFDGDTGQGRLLHDFGLHMFYPGEAYLVGVYNETADVDTWRLLSTDECKEQTPGKWVIDRGDGVEEKYDIGPDSDDDVVIIRLWRPHPRKHIEATSPVRAALPILRELDGLTKHVASSIDSRLTGAGILLIASEMTFQTPVTIPTADNAGGGDVVDPYSADAFVEALIDTAAAAVADPSSAAARIPIPVKVPGAFIGNGMQHITFDSPLSEQAIALREEAIRRLALSLDMPPEVLLGQAESNHWSAWLISEDAIKVHIEPLVSLLLHALTTRYLWLILTGEESDPTPDVRRFTIRGDTSTLRQRPSHTQEALTLHDRGVISDAAVLRETGFDPADAISEEERRIRLLLRTAGGVTTPDLTAAALTALGVNLTPAPSQVETAEGGTTAEQVPTTQPPATPAIEERREPPQAAASTGDDALAAAMPAIVAAGEVLVLRAVERGWNKAGQRGRTRRKVDPSRLDDVLADAWVHVPSAATRCGLDPVTFAEGLDAYARTLLATANDHDPETFATYFRPFVRPATPVLPRGA